jgi:hypothetical protein
MKASHEHLINLINAGEIAGGVHSSGIGSGRCIVGTAGAMLTCAENLIPETAPGASIPPTVDNKAGAMHGK